MAVSLTGLCGLRAAISRGGFLVILWGHPEASCPLESLANRGNGGRYIDYVLRIQHVVLWWLTFKIEERVADKLVMNCWPRTESKEERIYMTSSCSTRLPLFLCLPFLLKTNRSTVFLEQSDSSSDFCLPCCHQASLLFTCPAFP